MVTEQSAVTVSTHSLQTFVMDLGAQKWNRNQAGDFASSQLESMGRKESPWEQE